MDKSTLVSVRYVQILNTVNNAISIRYPFKSPLGKNKTSVLKC